jgi:hypothetical protein
MVEASLAQLVQRQAALQAELMQMHVRQAWEEGLRQPRYQQPKRLARHGHKIYSQNDEDGIIQEVLRRIGPIPRTFIEFGVQDGLECNSLALLVDGWRGLWLEGSDAQVRSISGRFGSYLASGQLKVAHAMVTRDNVNELFQRSEMIGDVGLLSIDIDSNDIWVWRAVTVVRPAVVVIEYNATWAPPLRVAQPDNPKQVWDGTTNYFGASLAALEQVGAAKGYNLVGCNFSGANAFFVRSDLCGELFHKPFTAAEHYEPARYWLRHLSAGHAPGIGPLVTPRD